MQSVHLTGFDSETLYESHGVPQWPMVGPSLFLIYSNDLKSAAMNTTVIHKADDTSLISKQRTSHLEFKEDLKRVVQWLKSN